MYLLKATLFMLSVASLTVNATFVERFENWVNEFRQEFHTTEHREGVLRKWIENDKYIAQPYIEGTMINLFWSSSIDDWEITTRSNIGANCHYNMDNNITFRTMFLEAMVFSGVEFESFNKDFMYSFVLLLLLLELLV